MRTHPTSPCNLTKRILHEHGRRETATANIMMRARFSQGHWGHQLVAVDCAVFAQSPCCTWRTTMTVGCGYQDRFLSD